MAVNRLPGNFRRAPGTLKELQRLALPLTHNVAVQEIGIVKKRGLHPVQAGYDVAHRAIINPFGRDYTVIYGAWGGDTANPLLSTDATTLVGIDKKQLSANRLEEALVEWGRYENRSKFSDAKEMRIMKSYRYGHYFWLEGFITSDFPRLVIMDLKMLGVRRSSIRITTSGKSYSDDGYIDIDFRWAYPGGPLRDRKIRIFKADLIVPDSYPPALAALIARGFDVYFQKSAMECIDDLQNYLPWVIKGARKCILISPTPGSLPSEPVNKSVARSLEKARYIRFGHINPAYAGLFRQYSADPSAVIEYNWLVELWVKMGAGRATRNKPA